MNVASFPLYNILEDAPRANINDQAITDYWLESADYVNIDFITFGWRVPLRPSRYIESLRLSFTMDNVCTFTGYSGLTPMLNSSALNNTLGVTTSGPIRSTTPTQLPSTSVSENSKGNGLSITSTIRLRRTAETQKEYP